MLEIRLFRFDTKIDILSYCKPYFYENYDFKTLKDLLNDIKKNDPYFDFTGVKFVKINGTIVSIDEDLSSIVHAFSNELLITPLSEIRAVKDLITNNDDFIKKFEAFVEFEGEKEFYLSLEPLFYSNLALRYSENFLGNSAFVFAKYLLQKYPEKKEVILGIIRSQMVYFYPPKILNDPFDCIKSYEFLKSELNISNKDKKQILNPANLSEKSTKFKHNFSNFNIAVFGDAQVRNFVKNMGANVISFDLEDENCGYKIYPDDRHCAINLAKDIIFDAFDSGSDFLLVNDEDAFFIFDAKSGEIQKEANRELSGYYVLKFDEFIVLANGEKLNSKEHKLTVTL